jgi:transposase InsO family protein
VDIYGSLPVSKGNVRYVFVCYDTFSKFIKLFALKSATTKACLNRLVNQYFGSVVKPKVILSDNASQFRSPSWRKQLQQHGVDVRFTPIRHRESNPSESCMRQLSKFCRIYCRDSHKKWAELLPHIGKWINNTVASGTGYTPTELMYGVKRPSVFDKVMSKVQGQNRTKKTLR